MDIKNVLIRFPFNEYIKVKEYADTYTNGNVTAWILYAATHHIPAKEDLLDE